MAEAHSAVAFSFTISHDGININYDHEIFHAVWQSGMRSWRRFINKFWNSLWTGAYPASPYSLLLISLLIAFLTWKECDVSYGVVDFLALHLSDNPLVCLMSIAAFYIGYSLICWFLFINIVRYFTKMLFSYKGWMYQARSGRMLLRTRLWLAVVSFIVKRKPQLFSFQGSLPNLPVPPLENTMDRYLLSVKPLVDEEKYKKMEALAEEFKNTIGKKLQRYLVLKSWWATNYVIVFLLDYVSLLCFCGRCLRSKS